MRHESIDRSVDRTVKQLVGRADLRVSAFQETGLSDTTLAAIRGTPGVAIYGAPDAEPYLYLASYALAPRPVRMAPERLPPGWIAAIYGGGTPPGARIVAHWDGGTLAAPAP